MQAVDVRSELRAVGGFGGGPVAQRGLGRFAVSQTVGDGKAGVPLQLGQHHQHLPAVGDREHEIKNKQLGGDGWSAFTSNINHIRGIMLCFI